MLAAVFGAGGASAQETLSGAQIQSALKDKSVVLNCIDGTKGTGRYTMGRNFGTIRGTYSRPRSEPVSDVGQVRAEGDRLCLRFNMLNAGEEKCFSVAKTAPGRFQFSLGFVQACEVVVR